MVKIKHVIIIFISFQFQDAFSQSVEIQGKIESDLNVENINVINKTSQFFTITDSEGRFKIRAKLNDTLLFSSIQHKPKTVIIDKNIIVLKAMRVFLEEKINELDEVVVGKILTGNLLLDISKTEGDPPINFYDVGIPGYTGKPATISERKLNEATTGSGIIPLNPIINALTGRTKMLKNRVKIDEKEALMQSIKARLEKDFLASNPLQDDLVMDFFYFCADDENFIVHCKNQTDFKILIFLRMKYRQYLENLNANKN
ncbi:carboxypeptidase-like regulatory domain-containing protein [Yeosuana marina]|uniref:carboxypeptidase-like regulatory domain-containing protein n=1 Tax=Yeosuana marina TaxID=1565536 RepID=UPI0030C847B7|tara:strand:+ start:1099 stop:1872 length:774 start_codon:yes stop_codon:yes gene_type:complete